MPSRSPESQPAAARAPSSDIAFTPTVKAEQVKRGSRALYEKMEEKGGFRTGVSQDLADFLRERDSFYLGTVNADGQPYIQHRGGPKGFLLPIGDDTLAFADFAGNRQYVTIGNATDNPKAFIFLMDYPNRRRIKMWGTLGVIEPGENPDADTEALMRRLTHPGYKARPERIITFKLAAWDVNCPQHIQPRYDEQMLFEITEAMRTRITQLEDEIARLKAQVSGEG